MAHGWASFLVVRKHHFGSSSALSHFFFCCTCIVNLRLTSWRQKCGSSPSPKWGQDQGVTISSAAPYRSEAAPARQWLTLRLRLDERFWNCKAKWASDRQSFFLSQRSLNHNITPLLIASGTSKAMSCGPSRCWMPSRGASSQKNFMTLSLIYNILEAKFLFLSSDGSNADM